jgi:hypothetical protein
MASFLSCRGLGQHSPDPEQERRTFLRSYICSNPEEGNNGERDATQSAVSSFVEQTMVFFRLRVVLPSAPVLSLTGIVFHHPNRKSELSTNRRADL